MEMSPRDTVIKHFWHQCGQQHYHKTRESVGSNSRHKNKHYEHSFLVTTFFFGWALFTGSEQGHHDSFKRNHPDSLLVTKHCAASLASSFVLAAQTLAPLWGPVPKCGL